VNFWDHFHSGAQAYESLQVMVRQSTFPNLMDTHPPGVFQIDGNLGAANGMLEALVQSRWMPDACEVELLPALPEQWAEGSLEGIHVRGGATLDMQWKGGKVIFLKVRAKRDGAIRLVAPPGQAISKLHASDGKSAFAEKDGTIRLAAGDWYQVTFK
jgi:alpha-L-fucosidase 2